MNNIFYKWNNVSFLIIIKNHKGIIALHNKKLLQKPEQALKVANIILTL